MSDDLVRCFSTYSVMMAEDEDVKWVKHKDYKAAADRIEELEAERDKAWKTCLAATTRGMELEAKLAKAVEALDNYSCDCGDMCEPLNGTCGDTARTTLAELKGQEDE